MKTLQIKTPRNKLKTVSNYSKLYGKNRATVYQLIKDKALKTEVIDGVTFVIIG